jgi:hypothetical protein
MYLKNKYWFDFLTLKLGHESKFIGAAGTVTGSKTLIESNLECVF